MGVQSPAFGLATLACDSTSRALQVFVVNITFDTRAQRESAKKHIKAVFDRISDPIDLDVMFARQGAAAAGLARKHVPTVKQVHVQRPSDLVAGLLFSPSPSPDRTVADEALLGGARVLWWPPLCLLLLHHAQGLCRDVGAV